MAAVRLIERFKPYPEGCNVISQLHRIDIADKHLLLIPVAAAQHEFGVRLEIKRSETEHLPAAGWLKGPAPDRKFPLKDGDELLAYNRLPSGPKLNDQTDFHFGFEIAFGEGQIFDGEPVIPTLTLLVTFTERLIGIFARRILNTSW